MAERVSQLAAFVNRPRRRRRNMARDSSRKRELHEQLLQAGLVLRYVWINISPSAFEVNVAHNRWAAVSRAGYVEHVQVVFFNDPVQMHVDEVLTWGRAPGRPPRASHATA